MGKEENEELKELKLKRNLCDLRMQVLDVEINLRASKLPASRKFQGVTREELDDEMKQKAEERKELTKRILKLSR